MHHPATGLGAFLARVATIRATTVVVHASDFAGVADAADPPTRRPSPANVADLVDREFGRLEVLSRAGTTPTRRSTWTCRCRCGAIKVIPGYQLTAKDGTKSCGCLRREMAAALGRGHRGKAPRDRKAG